MPTSSRWALNATISARLCWPAHSPTSSSSSPAPSAWVTSWTAIPWSSQSSSTLALSTSPISRTSAFATPSSLRATPSSLSTPSLPMPPPPPPILPPPSRPWCAPLRLRPGSSRSSVPWRSRGSTPQPMWTRSSCSAVSPTNTANKAAGSSPPAPSARPSAGSP